MKYILAVLNSQILSLWCKHKNTSYGSSLDYFGRSLDQIPIRRIRFEPPTDEAVKETNLSLLKSCLEGGNYDSFYTILQQALTIEQEDVVHDGLVMLVEQIIKLKTTLATYNPYFKARLTQLEESDSIPEIEPLSITQQLPSAEQWSIDIYIQQGELDITYIRQGVLDATENPSIGLEDFYVHRIKAAEDNNTIILFEKGRKANTMTLRGNPELIDYLKSALPAQKNKYWREVKKTLIPKNLRVYREKIQNIVQAVEELRDQIEDCQEVINKIVLELYGIADQADLETISL